MLSKRLFQMMLFAYPREFRIEYGPEMTQVFRDCYRDTESHGLLTATGFWLRITLDVIRTAAVERWTTLMKGSETMNNLKRDVIGVVACVAIIAVALFLLGYLRTHATGSILLVGYALDAIVVAGVISNLVIFLLRRATRFATFRTALWTLLIVNGALLLIATLIGIRVGGFSFPLVFLSYVVSFAFWLTIHWFWSQTKTSPEPAA
jgi:hypothetical protein